MNYIDGEPFCYDTAESQNEAAAQHQIALDVLYSIECEYSIKQDHMKQLCRISLIDFSELQNHSTNSTESTTPCLSQQCSLVNLAPEKQPACAT